ncbi:MAG: hypothetical protein ABIJ92_00630 [Candidatus Aenigmatarchaeota archaeon]
MDLVKLSRDLAYEQCKKNDSPPWLLTEIAIRKGKELAKKYNVDEKLVLVSLYLSHTIFDNKTGNSMRENHPQLSADFSKKYLDEWKVDEKEKKIILNSIEAHHDKVPTESKIAEVVKNAECFKFVTIEGSLIWLHELGLRGFSYEDSVKYVLKKMNDKKKLLTLNDCIKEAEVTCKKIIELFVSK